MAAEQGTFSLWFSMFHFIFTATELVKDILDGSDEKKEEEEKKDEDTEASKDEAAEKKDDSEAGPASEEEKKEVELTIEQLQRQIDERQAELDKRLEERRAKARKFRSREKLPTQHMPCKDRAVIWICHSLCQLLLYDF